MIAFFLLLLKNNLFFYIINKNIKTVNLVGLDGEGKNYLCKLYKERKKVIPTFDNVEEAKQFENVDEYVLKQKSSFGSGIGQKVVKKDELENNFEEEYLIQPKIEFKSEVQCYFFGNQLMYVNESYLKVGLKRIFMNILKKTNF